LSQLVYDDLAGKNAPADRRFFLDAYLTAGLTEHWRSTRLFAGVLYLAYLDGEGPHVFTDDNFKDVKTLEFQPYFEDYMGQAFKPLGVNVVFWQPKLQAGSKRSFKIVLTNDTDEPLGGKLALTLAARAGAAIQTQAETAFDVPASGQKSYDLELAVPAANGEFELKASAECGKLWCPTVARRMVTVGP
jgi:hypothetical protein